MKPVRPMSRFGRRMTHAHTLGARLDKRQETIRASKSIGRGIQAVLPVAAGSASQFRSRNSHPVNFLYASMPRS